MMKFCISDGKINQGKEEKNIPEVLALRTQLESQESSDFEC